MSGPPAEESSAGDQPVPVAAGGPGAERPRLPLWMPLLFGGLALIGLILVIVALVAILTGT